MQFTGNTGSIIYVEVQTDGSLIFKGTNASDLVKIQDTLSGNILDILNNVDQFLMLIHQIL